MNIYSRPIVYYTLLMWRVHRWLIVAVVRMQPCAMGKVPQSGVKPEYPHVYNTWVFNSDVPPMNKYSPSISDDEGRWWRCRWAGTWCRSSELIGAVTAATASHESGNGGLGQYRWYIMYRWSGSYHRPGWYLLQSRTDPYAEKTGSSAWILMVLVSLIDSVGIIRRLDYSLMLYECLWCPI